jgi:hypothetical protein
MSASAPELSALRPNDGNVQVASSGNMVGVASEDIDPTAGEAQETAFEMLRERGRDASSTDSLGKRLVGPASTMPWDVRCWSLKGMGCSPRKLRERFGVPAMPNAYPRQISLSRFPLKVAHSVRFSSRQSKTDIRVEVARQPSNGWACHSFKSRKNGVSLR